VQQAIIVAIDQYAEAATGNREFFLKQATQRGEQGEAGRRIVIV
jgi:hypothetical protein